MEKRLYRSSSNKMVAGVCGGLGEYFDVDPTLVRVIFIVLTLSTGVFGIGYLLAWIIVPKKESIDWQQPSAGPQVGATFSQPPRKEYSSWTRYLPGLILILIGVILLLQETIFWFDLQDFWPVVLIIIGLALIASRQARLKAGRPRNHQQASTGNGGALS